MSGLYALVEVVLIIHSVLRCIFVWNLEYTTGFILLLEQTIKNSF